MNKIDISTLEIFIASVEEKSFSMAGNRENLVISTVSKRISDLEKYLNKKLFIRHGRGVEATPAGILLYHHSKSIIKNIQKTEEILNNFEADGLAKIVLIANPSAILQFLPSSMEKVIKKNKNISIDLVEAHSFDIPRLISESKGDIGIYHSEQPATGVISYLYRKDRVCLVVPNGHPLSHKECVFFEEALDFDLLGYFPRHSLESFLSYIGDSVSRPPSVKLQVSNFESRCRMIQEGIGIGIVPEKIAENYLKNMGLKMIKLLDDWSERHFYLCVNSHAKIENHFVKNIIKLILK